MASLRIACRSAIAAAIVLMSASTAHADLLVGDFRGADASAPVFRYTDYADAADAPLLSFYTNLGGGTDVLHSATAMTFEPIENTVYVADFYGQAIRVYPATATGNAAALRTLNPPSLGHPRQIAINFIRDLQIVATDCCVVSYLLTDSGSAAFPQRMLPSGNTADGSRTRLNNPGGVILRPSTEEIAIPDNGVSAGASFGVVLFFYAGLTGNCAPGRTLEGPATLLGAAAVGIAYDAAHDELMVLSRDSAQAPYGFRINVFAGSASGNTAPLRSISGASTLLDDVHAIAWDAATETLYASAGGEGGVPARVLAFGRDATGDAAPERVIAGSDTSFAQPQGLVAVFDDIFKNGFN